MNDTIRGKPIPKLVTTWWAQYFMQSNQNVFREQKGKISTSMKNEELVEMEVSFHLENLKRVLDGGILTEECMSLYL